MDKIDLEIRKAIVPIAGLGTRLFPASQACKKELFPVVGAISAAIGALAALEAIKILSQTGEPMFGRLWMIDAHQNRSGMVELRRDPDCPCCGPPAGQAT